MKIQRLFLSAIICFGAVCCLVPAKGEDVISLETLHKLRPGMTYSAVCEILGKSGDCKSENNETPEGTTTTHDCTFWWNFGTASAKMVICEFKDNQLTSLTNNFGEDGKPE